MANRLPHFVFRTSVCEHVLEQRNLSVLRSYFYKPTDHFSILESNRKHVNILLQQLYIKPQRFTRRDKLPGKPEGVKFRSAVQYRMGQLVLHRSQDNSFRKILYPLGADVDSRITPPGFVYGDKFGLALTDDAQCFLFLAEKVL